MMSGSVSEIKQITSWRNQGLQQCKQLAIPNTSVYITVVFATWIRRQNTMLNNHT